MTQISESRTRELLQWLDDQAGDHTHLFEQMARYRDAAALIRQLQAENAQLKRHLDRVLTTHDWHTYDGREASDAAIAYLDTLTQQPGGSDNDR